MKYKVLGKQHNSENCFVCGIKNEASLKADFFNCEKENGEKVLLTVAQPKDFHQSYPNRMHGGVISALLDESMGRAAQVEIPEIWAVTTELCIKFRKPTPLDQTLYVESKLTNFGSRMFEGEGKLFTKDGTVLAMGTGKFFRVSGEAIFPEEAAQKKEFLVQYNKEYLPEYIEV